MRAQFLFLLLCVSGCDNQPHYAPAAAEPIIAPHATQPVIQQAVQPATYQGPSMLDHMAAGAAGGAAAGVAHGVTQHAMRSWSMRKRRR